MYVILPQNSKQDQYGEVCGGINRCCIGVCVCAAGKLKQSRARAQVHAKIKPTNFLYISSLVLSGEGNSSLETKKK